MAISLCCAPKENHPGNLEIEHVSPIVAFVYNHMLLMALAWSTTLGRPMHCLQVTENEDLESYMGTEDKLAMVYGRTLWKDFVTFSIC